MIEDAAQAIKQGQRFLVTTHLNPDGDAIGSMLGVMHLLRGNGKEAVAYHCDPVPGACSFLAGADEVLSTPGATEETFDTLIVVDVGERERIPASLPTGTEEARVVVIDHHMHHGSYGDVVWRRKAAAVGEMVIELARYLEWEVTLECAECAYTAILSDTGSFRYSSTTSTSLEIASFLVSLGVQPWKVASHVYESWPAQRMQLLGDVLNTLEFDCQGKLALLNVTQEILRARGASIDMTEGFVNQGRMIAGVDVSVLLREIGPEEYRLSFRSRGRVDVGAIAIQLGGGGHRNAAGANGVGDIKKLKQRIADLVADALLKIDPDSVDCWSKH